MIVLIVSTDAVKMSNDLGAELGLSRFPRSAFGRAAAAKRVAP
jgi:hypothetical protein